MRSMTTNDPARPASINPETVEEMRVVLGKLALCALEYLGPGTIDPVLDGDLRLQNMAFDGLAIVARTRG